MPTCALGELREIAEIGWSVLAPTDCRRCAQSYRYQRLSRLRHVLSNDDVIPALAVVCPSVAGVWAEVIDDELRFDDDGSRLHYVDVWDVVTVIVDLHRDGNTGEVQAAFHVFERFLIDGRPETRELIIVGYLEDLQNASLSVSIPLDEWVPDMGPETRRWWRGVRAFWEEGRFPLAPLDPGPDGGDGHLDWLAGPTRTSRGARQSSVTFSLNM